MLCIKFLTVLMWFVFYADAYFLLSSLDGWENRWVKSDWKKDENTAGEWNYTSGKWNGDPNDKGANFSFRLAKLIL